MILETAIALIVIFSVLVVAHEFGHFIVAKRSGIRVDEFALGFGPRVVRLFKKGDTEYTIHLFPLGGFVKLAGMEPGEEDIPDGFQAQSAWKRAFVIFAGPLASFLLAVAVFVFLGVFWGFPHPYKTKNQVGMVFPKTEAARIGLRAGDKIISINNKQIKDGSQVLDIIHNSPGERVSIVIERNGHKIRKAATPKWSVDYLGVRWSFMNGNRPVAEDILDDSIAKKAGIQQKDELISINGERIFGGREMVQAIEAAGTRPAKIALLRNGKTFETTVRPSYEYIEFIGVRWQFSRGFAYVITENRIMPKHSTAAKSGLKMLDKLVSINGKKIDSPEQMLKIIRSAQGGNLELVVERAVKDKIKKKSIVVKPTPDDFAGLNARLYDAIGLLGFVPEHVLEKMGLIPSIKRGLVNTGLMLAMLFDMLKKSDIKEQVGGPIMIAKLTHSSVSRGPYSLISWLGGLSLSLAIINLLPIPVLDGGHLAILGIEAIRRKKFTAEQMYKIQFAGLAIILTLVIVVMMSDISKLIGGMVPQ